MIKYSKVHVVDGFSPLLALYLVFSDIFLVKKYYRSLLLYLSGFDREGLHVIFYSFEKQWKALGFSEPTGVIEVSLLC